MNWRLIKYLFAAAAPILLFTGWKGANALSIALQCEGSLKSAQPCYVYGVDATPILSAVAWWGMLLWLPALVITALVFGELLVRYSRARQ